MKTKKIKNAEVMLVQVLAMGANITQAAKQTGISERTIHRRLSESNFIDQIQQVRFEMLSRTTGALTAACTEAVRTLLQLQQSSAPPAVRLGSARSILEISLKLKEITDLEVRIQKLETTLSA